MKNKLTVLLITTLISFFVVGQAAVAGQAPRDEFSIDLVYTTEAPDVERANYSLQESTASVALDQTVFADHEH